MGFPGGSEGKEPSYDARDTGLLPGWGRSPGEGMDARFGSEKGMATHSSILAWIIPRTGEPSRLLSMGSHRVGHD